MNAGSPLDEIMALRAALAQAEARADAAEADAAQARAKVSSDQAFIAYLKLEIEKLRRDLYGGLPSARPGCSTRWNCSWKSWRRRRARTSWPPNRPPPRPLRSRRS